MAESFVIGPFSWLTTEGVNDGRRGRGRGLGGAYHLQQIQGERAIAARLHPADHAAHDEALQRPGGEFLIFGGAPRPTEERHKDWAEDNEIQAVQAGQELAVVVVTRRSVDALVVTRVGLNLLRKGGNVEPTILSLSRPGVRIGEEAVL